MEKDDTVVMDEMGIIVMEHNMTHNMMVVVMVVVMGMAVVSVLTKFLKNKTIYIKKIYVCYLSAHTPSLTNQKKKW